MNKTIVLVCLALHICDAANFALPKLTLVIVIDQFAYYELQKFNTKMFGGIGKLYKKGICYHYVLQPHGAPVTATGHASIATGVLPDMHGIINNSWYNEQGKWIACDHDTPENAAVFGEPNVGISAHNLMVDTLADQIVLNAPKRFSVVSLSNKSRAAVMMAGHMGNPFWFDSKGILTSSKAFMPQLPSWVKKFNDTCVMPVAKLESPQAVVNLLEAAYAAITDWHTRKPTPHLVVWLSISSLDKIGHKYGPDHPMFEHMLMTIDQQLDRFLRRVYAIIPRNYVLHVLTSDHGVHPVLETVAQKGYDQALRISGKNLKKQLNSAVKQQFGLSKMVRGFRVPFCYINVQQLNALSAEKKLELLEFVKEQLKQQRGIKDAWLTEEFDTLSFGQYDIRYFLQHQRYKGRSGQIMIQVQPYVALDSHTSGTKHNIPYNYNMQVPLILYQRNRLQKKSIYERILIQQLSVTLAHILDVPRPSACQVSMLPGISR